MPVMINDVNDINNFNIIYNNTILMICRIINDISVPYMCPSQPCSVF